MTNVFCDAAKIDQPFADEDIAALIVDLPNLVLAEREYQAKKGQVVRFRISSEEKGKIEERARNAGFRSVSEYARKTLLQA